MYIYYRVLIKLSNLDEVKSITKKEKKWESYFMKKIAVFIMTILITTISFSENLLQNGDFSNDRNNDFIPDYWRPSSKEGIKLQKEGKNKFVYIYNEEAQYKVLEQIIKIKPGKIKKITVKANIKINNVIPGPKEWEMARVMVLFYNKNNKQIGGWPELDRWSGSWGWTNKYNIIDVPSEAKKIKVQLQLSNCTGEMWIDDVEVKEGIKIDIPKEEGNLIVNGDMEYGLKKPLFWEGVIVGEGKFESPGYNSASCFSLFSPTTAYSMLTQQIALDGRSVASINISGYYKTENVVQGKNSWEKVRIGVVFYGERGRIGDWPKAVGEITGTVKEWTKMEKTYDVPETTKYIIVSIGFLQASGIAYFDKIKVTAKNKAGNSYVSPEIIVEDKSDWYAFSEKNDTYKKNAIIDFTSMLDKPAGKHGFIKISENGKAIFEDNTPARFWGTNIVDSDVFRSHKQADKIVKRLAKLGCNLVRLHHMDASWANPNIFGTDPNNTRKFSKNSLDRLDYLFYKLKNAGIYSYIDIVCHRKPGKNDGLDNYEKVSNGFKGSVYVDEELQKLTKEYIKNLFEHYNPYTKLKYKDDPAFVFTDIVNENSLFYMDRDRDLDEYYVKRIDELFNDYLKDKYKTMEDLRKAWDKFGDSDLGKEEDFNIKSVKREAFNINWEVWDAMFTAKSTGRGSDTKEFYSKTQSKFYKGMYDYIKALGVRALVTGSNHWELWDADLFANNDLDFIDRHSYWDHPVNGWTLQENISFKNIPILKSKMNCIAELAHARVYKKPFVVSEWNFLMPNEFRIGGPIVMAAYSKYQDWDAVMQFNFSTYEWENVLKHFCDFSRSPSVLSQWFPAIMMYRYGYVSTEDVSIVEYVSKDDIFNNKNSSFKLVNDNYTSPLVVKIAKTFDEKEKKDNVKIDMDKDVFNSMNKELSWDIAGGIFKIETKKIQGVVGFVKDKEFKFSNIKILSKNKYAAMFLISLDKKDIVDSSELILNVVARIENSGVEYSPQHTSVIYGGEKPIMIEPIYGKYDIAIGDFKKVKIYSLNSNNYIKKEYKNYKIRKNILTIHTDEKSKSFNYYIKIVR